MTDVKTLVNKKRFTGHDLGRIEITNMCLLFKRIVEEDKSIKPLMEISKLRTLINTLSRTETQIYNKYVDLHDWITLKFNISQTHMQQAQLQLKIIWEFLSEGMLAEEFYTYDAKIKAENKPPVPQNIYANSLKLFIDEDESFEANKNDIIYTRNIFMDSYYLMINYNISLDMIGEAYGIPAVEIFKRDMSKIDAQIKEFNTLRSELYTKIKTGEYINTEQTKQKKLDMLDECFMPINVDNMTASKKNIETIKGLLKDFKVFDDPTEDPIHTLLYIRNMD